MKKILVVGLVLASFVGRAEGFEFQPFDSGSEVQVVVAAESSRAAIQSLPTIRAGTIGGRWAVQGVYERVGKRAYFETRRGAPAQDPSIAAEMPYEVDTCWRDANGFPVYVSQGGDQPLIPGCDPESIGSMIDAHPEVLDGKPRQFNVVKRAMKAVGGTTFSPFFAQERRELSAPVPAIRGLRQGVPKLSPGTQVIREDDIVSQAPPLGLDAPMPVSETATVSATSAIFKHYLTVWRAPALYVTPFDHSATLAYLGYSLNGGAFTWLLTAWEDRNHGRHWYEWPMRSKCYFESRFGRTNHVHHVTCSTPYQFLSSDGGHNCNDDTFLEYLSVRYDVHYNAATGVPCADPLIDLYATSCF